MTALGADAPVVAGADRAGDLGAKVPLSYSGLYESDVLARIDLVRRGMPAVDAKHLLDVPELGRMALLSALDLPVATLNGKVRAQARLSASEGECVVGFARLVGQVEAMVRDAGTSEGFDARTWLARWLSDPVPALGHRRPLDLLSTMAGQALVSDTLARAAYGVYA